MTRRIVGRKWKARTKGKRFGDQAAKEIGEWLEALAEKVGEESYKDLQTKAIRKALLKDKKSPIRKFLTWDKDKAFEYWHLHQIRQITQNLEVEVIYDDGETERIRAYKSVEVQYPVDGEVNVHRAYVPIDSLNEFPQLLNQTAEAALKWLLHWKEEYRKFGKEFGTIFKAIDDLEQSRARYLDKLSGNIKDNILNTDPSLKRAGSSFKSAVIVMLGCHINGQVSLITKHAKYTSQFVSVRKRRLMKAGIWGDLGPISGHDWRLTDSDTEAFWQDVYVAEGLV